MIEAAALFYQVVGALLAAGAVYGGIRADIKRITKVEQRVDKIEDRFNNHIEKGLNHGNS
jgi:hypothetical protein